MSRHRHISAPPAFGTACNSPKPTMQAPHFSGTSRENAKVQMGYLLLGEARAARHVPVGQSWAFTDHRTMAEVMATEGAI